MSESRFTKGDWSVDEYIGIDESIRVMVGNILISYHGHATEEDVANAHLIAAAPEMYGVLQLICDVANGKTEFSLDEIDVLAVEELLAKARGEK